MLNFCTLFDSNYLARGLVMYDSLVKHSRDFHLYVFAFNDSCFEVLTQFNLPKMTVVSLKEFEDEELLSVKSSRSRAEYCWTCTSSTIRYVIENFGADHCTYLDADLVFYDDPAILLREVFGHGSVLITSHNYAGRYDQSAKRGKYCVQFMYFHEDQCGRKVLDDWRKDCLNWCYARVEDGKFGDQKYLDAWKNNYPCIHELEHKGGGVAPWNCLQYKFDLHDSKISAVWKPTGQVYEMVFFHFHGVKLYENGKSVFAPRSYILGKQAKELFYKPYIKLLKNKEKELKETFPEIDPNGKGDGTSYFREKFLEGHIAWITRNIFNRRQSRN